MDGRTTSLSESPVSERQAKTRILAPASAAPVSLPTDPRSFYRAAPEAETLVLTPERESKHVLEQLGPPPFRKTSFPFIGFLASLYEHIAAHITRQP